MTLGNEWILDNGSFGEMGSTAYPANNFSQWTKTDLNSLAKKSNFKNFIPNDIRFLFFKYFLLLLWSRLSAKQKQSKNSANSSLKRK